MTKALRPEQLVRPFLPEAQVLEVVQSGLLSVRFATYNALSLATDKRGASCEGLAFVPARPALLASQFEAAGVTCAAVQEARTEEGWLCTGPFMRYCSGSDKGHFGVELWFHSKPAILSPLSGSKTSVRFEQSAFVVLHRDPRRLVMLFKQGGFQLVFAALHAPHRGADPDAIKSWWGTTEAILFRASRGRLLLVGADCNASLGSVESASVSSAGAEIQDLPGECLHALMGKCGLWAPATWSDVHSGPHWTFMQRRNGALCRPDFVLIPFEWKQGVIASWTDASIVAANAVIDHIAAVIQVDLRTSCRVARAGDPKGRIDTAALCDPQNKARLEGILAGAPRPTWNVTAHAHAAIVTEYLQTNLQAAFPLQRKKPLHPYLSDTAWALQQQVAWLRRRCARVRSGLRNLTLAGVFYAWRDGPQSQSASSAWLRDAQVAEALYGFRLSCFAKALRARCKRDRVTYLESLADDVQANRVGSYAAVNRLLSRRRKKPYAPTVLPAVNDAHGQPCETPEAIIERWREFFSAMEDGVECFAGDLISSIEQDPQLWPAPPAITDLPAPPALRNAIMAAKRGKACGPDRIPGELGLSCSGPLQDILYPLLLKLGLLGEESIGYKGGCLTRLWKGRGSRAACESYRGILLLSNLCKSLHRAFRPSIQAHFETSAAPMQLGGRKGASVLFGSHAMRTFMRHRAAEGLSSAVIFADVSAAYYSTIRALAARLPQHEPMPIALEHASAAGPVDLSELQRQMQQPSAMSQGGASSWLCALTATLNSGTWMYLQGDTTPVATRRGTRPGSAWADLTFGVVVRRVLALRDEGRAATPKASRPACIAWDSCRHWGPPESCTSSVLVEDLVWADDVACCLPVERADALGVTVGLEAGLLADAFQGHDLSLSFGPRKTAAIVCPRGAGSRAARRALFGGKAEIQVWRDAVGCSALPLVEAYKHLGVLQASEGSIKPKCKPGVLQHGLLFVKAGPGFFVAGVLPCSAGEHSYSLWLSVSLPSALVVGRPLTLE